MRHGKLSREQVVQLFGAAAVAKLDGEDCDFTNRVQTDGDTDVEFSASVTVLDEDGDECTLVAYYYQPDHELDDCEDLSQLDWEIHGYEVI